MKKRDCKRFHIPGTVLFYKDKPGIFFKKDYPEYYFPVINMSRGGASFLCNERLKAGTPIVIKLQIPGADKEPELLGNVRWVSKNPEESYQYRTGIAFNSYGKSKNENPVKILDFFKSLE